MLIQTRHVRVSRRDAFLTLFGIVYALLGYSFLNVDAQFKPILKAQLRFALDIAPIEFYGWAWIVCGTIAIVGGVIHRLDGIGFAAGVYMPLIWSAANFGAAFDGVPRAWVGGVIYASLGLSMWIISGVPDPIDAAGQRRRRRAR